MEGRVRIADLAEELGVSTATVSNVIHGKTKKISKETVRRVQELVEKRGYIPSMAGILLAQNDSGIIGVAVNAHEKYEGKVLEDDFIAAALGALCREIESTGRFLMVKTTAQREEIRRFASMWNMEGLVLIGFCAEDYERLREEMHIPFVVYDGFFEHPRRVSNLIVDNFDGGRQAGRFLREMGHTRVLCISDNEICMDGERLRGCREGLSCAPDVLLVPMERAARQAFYERELSFIKSHTAVFAVSDVYAIELMSFLQSKGLFVPEDISVVGFDNIGWSARVYPELSTVGQDVAGRARLALAELARLRENPDVGRELVLPVRLIVRESVRRIQS